MILVDTNAWVFWLMGRGLGKRAERAMARSSERGLLPLCIWELAQLSSRGRIRLARPLEEIVDDLLRDGRTVLVPMSPAVAMEAARLPEGVGRDPVDRFLVATALELECAIVTKDERLRGQDLVPTIW